MKIPAQWIIGAVVHNNQKRIALRFPPNYTWTKLVKTFAGSRWSATMRAWHIADNDTHRQLLALPIVNTNKSAIKNNVVLTGETQRSLTLFVDWLKVKRYSENTITSYTKALLVF